MYNRRTLQEFSRRNLTSLHRLILVPKLVGREVGSLSWRSRYFQTFLGVNSYPLIDGRVQDGPLLVISGLIITILGLKPQLPIYKAIYNGYNSTYS